MKWRKQLKGIYINWILDSINGKCLMYLCNIPVIKNEDNDEDDT